MWQGQGYFQAWDDDIVLEKRYPVLNKLGIQYPHIFVVVDQCLN